MILWTIQTEAAWRDFQSRGSLCGTHSRIMAQSWQGAYQWMIEQMSRRIGPPPTLASYPVWAWYQYEGKRRARPDLRSGGHLPKGDKGVRIEFDCPDALALLSDFQLWHYVLSYWNLPETEEEGDRLETELKAHGLSFFDTKPLPHPAYHQRIVRSWDKIFDLDWSEDGLAIPRSKKSIQATVWELRLDQVRKETHFRAR